MHIQKKYLVRALVGMVLMSCLFVTYPAGAQSVCKTPDGFEIRVATENTKQPSPSRDEKDNSGKGVGGTGVRFANNDGKGIGGTGISFSGDILVKGRITGFGSICVNGLEVQYTKSTPVDMGGRHVSPEQLKIGQIVSLVAHQVGGDIVARHIAVEHIVTGQITEINPAQGRMTVGGHKVSVPNITKTAMAVAAGDRVNIGGFRNADGQIVASFVEKALPEVKKPEVVDISKDPRHVLFQGYVSAVSPNGKVEVSGHAIGIGSDTEIQGGKISDIAVNDRIVILGNVENGDNVRAEVISIEHKEIETVLPAPEIDPMPDKRDVEREKMGDESPDSEDAHEAEKEETETGEHEGSEVDTPESELPEMEGGEVEAPEVDAPEVEAPEVESPEIEAPEIEAPEIEAPEIETPEVEVPEIDVPEVEQPEPPEPPEPPEL